MILCEYADFSHKINCYKFLGDSKLHRAFKSHYWFKSYGDFAEWVDLPIGGASAMEGLRSMGLPRLVNKPSVAGSVLQSPPLLIH